MSVRVEMDPELVLELRDAIRARDRLRERAEQGRAKVHAVKVYQRNRERALGKAEEALREIEQELLTGRPALPLLSGAAGRDGAGRAAGYDRDVARAVEAAEAARGGDRPAAIEACRVCNRCNAVRSPAVGVCPECKSPEYRIEPRAGRLDSPPAAGRPSGAERRKRSRARKEGAGVEAQ